MTDCKHQRKRIESDAEARERWASEGDDGRYKVWCKDCPYETTIISARHFDYKREQKRIRKSLRYRRWE